MKKINHFIILGYIFTLFTLAPTVLASSFDDEKAIAPSTKTIINTHSAAASQQAITRMKAQLTTSLNALTQYFQKEKATATAGSVILTTLDSYLKRVDDLKKNIATATTAQNLKKYGQQARDLITESRRTMKKLVALNMQNHIQQFNRSGQALVKKADLKLAKMSDQVAPVKALQTSLQSCKNFLKESEQILQESTLFLGSFPLPLEGLSAATDLDDAKLKNGLEKIKSARAKSAQAEQNCRQLLQGLKTLQTK